jgi:hypothetical protein
MAGRLPHASMVALHHSTLTAQPRAKTAVEIATAGWGFDIRKIAHF